MFRVVWNILKQVIITRKIKSRESHSKKFVDNDLQALVDTETQLELMNQVKFMQSAHLFEMYGNISKVRK